MTMPSLTFPVLSIASGFIPAGEDDVGIYLGPDDFFMCTDWELRHHVRDGMMLFDSAGRGWRIDEVQDLGIRATLTDRLLSLLNGRPLDHVVACKMIEVEPASIDGLKTHVCAAITSNPGRWLDGEAAGGEGYPPGDEQSLLAGLQDKVRQARSVREIVGALHYALNREELAAEDHDPDGERRD
jgi:hypothetical protein